MAELTPTLETSQVEPGETDVRLSVSTLITYALPTVGTGYMFLLVGLYLMKFATDVLLVAPAAMGTIFGLSRIFDAISDPVAGYFSDRTSHSSGRRRPWIAVSAVPIALTFWMAWSPPASLEGHVLIAWMAVAVFGFYAAMTIFIVPHSSLGAEMSTNHHERSRIFGYRHVLWNVGSILALVGMWMLIRTEGLGEAVSRATASDLSLLAGGATAILLLYAASRLRERPENLGRGGRQPYRAMRDVLRNPHARLLLVVILIENLGAATIGILTPYVSEYIVGTPHLTVFFILAYMIPTIVSVPLWVRLSRRFGKKRLWLFGMSLTAAAFGGMFFLTEGSVWLITVLAVTGGFAGGCGGMLSPSVQSDVIDYDEYMTGERKEGVYMAAWNFVYKSAFGITLMLTGWVLSLTGFVPRAEQTETVKFALLALYALYPFGCYVAGALLFSRFALDEGEHARIRSELDAGIRSELDAR